MPTEFKAFLTTLHNRELDIIDGDYWDDDNQILAAAIAYQLYTQLEQTNSALGRIADALETIAKEAADDNA